MNNLPNTFKTEGFISYQHQGCPGSRGQRSLILNNWLPPPRSGTGWRGRCFPRWSRSIPVFLTCSFHTPFLFHATWAQSGTVIDQHQPVWPSECSLRWSLGAPLSATRNRVDTHLSLYFSVYLVPIWVSPRPPDFHLQVKSFALWDQQVKFTGFSGGTGKQFKQKQDWQKIL